MLSIHPEKSEAEILYLSDINLVTSNSTHKEQVPVLEESSPMLGPQDDHRTNSTKYELIIKKNTMNMKKHSTI